MDHRNYSSLSNKKNSKDRLKEITLENERVLCTIRVTDQSIKTRAENINQLQIDYKKFTKNIDELKFKYLQCFRKQKCEESQFTNLLQTLKLIQYDFNEKLTNIADNLKPTSGSDPKDTDDCIKKLKENLLYLEMELEQKQSEIELLTLELNKKNQKTLIRNNRHIARTNLLINRIQVVEIKANVIDKCFENLKSEIYEFLAKAKTINY